MPSKVQEAASAIHQSRDLTSGQFAAEYGLCSFKKAVVVVVDDDDDDDGDDDGDG